MPAMKTERYLTIVYEEDYVRFASKVSNLLKRGWIHLSSGCDSIPTITKSKKGKRGITITQVTTINKIYWMILIKTERVPI